MCKRWMKQEVMRRGKTRLHHAHGGCQRSIKPRSAVTVSVTGDAQAVVVRNTEHGVRSTVSLVAHWRALAQARVGVRQSEAERRRYGGATVLMGRGAINDHVKVLRIVRLDFVQLFGGPMHLLAPSRATASLANVACLDFRPRASMWIFTRIPSGPHNFHCP
jgi:hypothetical protein